MTGSSKLEKRGRPSREFEELAERSKRRKSNELRQSATSSELAYATAMNLRAEGDDSSAKLLKEATTTTPTRGKRIRDAWRKGAKQSTKMSVEEALSFIIKAKLTKHQYVTMRKLANKHNHDLYPSYYAILNAKKTTYPQNVIIKENECEAKLQDLLDHTASRILTMLPDESGRNYTLYCKWGFDGSSGHSQYKQTWSEAGKSDQSLFMSSVVPLRLVDRKTGISVWKNPRTSSTRFCRPIRMQWVHETSEISRAERDYVNDQIENLHNLIINNTEVQYSLILSMIDGKICNALAQSSSMKCYICGAKISEMNNLQKMAQKPVDNLQFEFGFSVLHAHIRFFECLLHISYRLEFKKWKASVKDGNRDIFERRKKIVQDSFRTRLGLLVDIPKPGYGTTNDGNTARRFFENPRVASEITGIDCELITRFGIILKAISSGHDINATEFNSYCSETASLYVRLYPWYYMPPTLHKILIHGSSIIEAAILPIGELSEEALESRNKDVRKYREDHTRKSSRISNNFDLFHRLLLSSDPVISSTGGLPKKKRRRLPKEVYNLLSIPEDETEQEGEVEVDIDTSGSEDE